MERSPKSIVKQRKQDVAVVYYLCKNLYTYMHLCINMCIYMPMQRRSGRICRKLVPEVVPGSRRAELCGWPS